MTTSRRSDGRSIETLRRDRELLASAERLAGLGSWAWEIAADEVYWSPQLRAIFGFADEQELTYSAYLEHVHPDDRAFVEEIVELVLSENQSIEFEHRIVTADGGERFLRCHASAEMSNGKVQRLLGTALDITDRRLIEQALHVQETRIRLLTEKVPAIIWSTDQSFRIVNTSGSALRGIIAHTHQLTGMYLPRFVSEQGGDGDLALESLGRALENDPSSFETELGGRVFLVHTEPLIDPYGRISGTVGVALDISEQRVAERQIEYQAYHDPLTGLGNRALFHDRAELGLARARRHGFPVGVLMLDLDDFRLINESLGRSRGDELLTMAARRLSQHVRETDTICRTGGNCFLILASEMRSADDALTIADTLLTALGGPFPIEGEQIHCSASIGVALYPGDGDDVEALVTAAEKAMFRVKSSGRNGYEVSQPSREATDRLSLTNALHHALERNEFTIHYQPIVNVESGCVTGAEALLRWSRDGELIPPSSFISLAEETRLIVPIGEWVLRTACAQARAWIDQAGIPFTIAVNLSARQFQRRDLPEQILDILNECGLPPHSLMLEITENMALKDVDLTASLLRRLRDMGIGIAMDDFGTGYSSLSYLKRFPVTSVKIDREFVTDITTDTGDEAIVTAVIALAHSLGISSTAEGVETEEQRSFLLDRACDEMQGYLVSRPLEAPVFFERFLGRGQSPDGASSPRDGTVA